MFAIAVGREGSTPGKPPKAGEPQRVKMVLTVDDNLWVILSLDPEQAETLAIQLTDEVAAAKGNVIIPSVTIPSGSKLQ